MKKFKLSIFISLINLVPLFSLAQSTNYTCKSLQQQQTAPNCFSSNNDVESSLYVPKANMPTLQFRVNFVFIEHPSIQTKYSALSIGQLTTDVASTINHLNNKFANCGNIPSFITPPNPSNLVSNPKIQIVLNKVYRVQTPIGISSNFYSNVFYNSFPYDTSNTINIYLYDETTTGNCGSAWASFGQYTALAECHGFYHTGGVIGGDLLWHELCHVFGYLSDHYNSINPFVSSQPNNINPASGQGYLPDDAAVDVAGNWNCSASFNLSTNPKNNNVMGNTACREHLSARQIAAFHFLVAKNITKKFTQFQNVAYTYTPTSNYYNSTVVLTSTQTYLASELPYNSITIKAGAHVTINNTTLNFTNSGKIYVEPGAKLELNCVKLKPAVMNPNNLWSGISVLGNPYLPQDLQPNGMSNNQGVLELNDCELINAGRAIRIGSFFNNHSGGGIVFANFTKFDRNAYCVDMTPKSTVSIAGSADNLTTFQSCSFISDNFFQNTCPAYSNIFVWLNGVKNVKFLDCGFNNNQTSIDLDTTYCIKGINSSIIAKKGIQNIGNSFWNADYGVFLVNSSATLEYNQFYTKNGMYLSNCNYVKAVNNQVNVGQVAPNGQLKTGLYLDNCNYYKIENNVFWNNSNKTLTEGICVNNSGPLTNKIYNNKFNDLEQGLWCQKQNYDPITYDGLVLNCNDFYNCDYNIGVQNPFLPNNNGGIAQTQGIAGGLPPTNARNTFSLVPTCGNDNKFYSFTPFANPPQVQHGNFLGAQFRVSPQPGCSDFTDVNDIVGLSAPPTKASYCPDLSNLPAGKHAITTQISELSGQLTILNTNLSRNLDGGNTAYILNAVATQANENTLFNQLNSLIFLSDTVIKSYFTRPDVLPSHLREIFEKNSPVTREVWQYIVNLRLREDLMVALTSFQNLNKLSPRALLEAQISLAKNERSYAIMHKSMLFLNSDSSSQVGTFINVKDSLAALIQLNNQGDVQKQLIELDVNFSDFTAATAKASTYTTTTQQRLYRDFITAYILIMQDSAQLYSLQTNSVTKQYIYAVATNYEHPCQVWAGNILNAVFNTPMDILKLQPQSNGGARLTNTPLVTESNEALITTAILMYPNPANNELVFENPTNETVNIKIYTVNSQLVLEQTLAAGSNKKINTTTLINGIYFVHLNSKTGINKINKLIIVK